MEKGNEGDEIIFLSLRQIGCAVPNDVVKVGQIGADLLVEIIVRSLLLITDGEAKFPLVLPQNIASRHRICTSIASKIKDLGYLSDCGYNQLLYPTENQTRDLLKWLVEKLPRTEEEGAQEVLGANALMNRRIMQSLKDWKSRPWKLHFCSQGKVLRNVYDNKQFRTVPGLLENNAYNKTLPVFQSSAQLRLPVECSLFERHTLEHVADAKYAMRLEQDFADSEHQLTGGVDDGDHGLGSAEAKRGDRKKVGAGEAMQQAIRTALQKAANGDSAATGAVGGAAGGAASGGPARLHATPADAALAKGLNGSLQDLLQEIAAGHQQHGGVSAGHGTGERGTRFSHAMEYGQEDGTAAALVATITGKSDGPSTAAASAFAGHAAGVAAAQAGAGGSVDGAVQGDAQDGSGAGAAGGAAAGAGAARRRQTQAELEEHARQEELDALRSEVQQYAANVELIVRNQQTAAARTKQYEADLQELLEETERREKDVLLKKRTLEMLPSARDNIAKLQEAGTAGAQRMLDLAQEWERHRQPLVTSLMEKEEVLNKRREKGRLMVEEIKRYRAEMGAMIQDLKDKQDRMQILNEEQAKLNKSINRAMYTHRIMDITNQIVKQNKDIDKITSDIRDLQKTINLSTSTLQRADAIAEELIFAAANDKNDPVMVDTYRRLKTLRSKFDELINTISKIGQQEKANRDLETKIDQEKSRVSSNNHERIKQDLEAIAQENAQLVAQIKAVNGGKAHK